MRKTRDELENERTALTSSTASAAKQSMTPPSAFVATDTTYDCGKSGTSLNDNDSSNFVLEA